MNSEEMICNTIRRAFGSLKLDGGLTINQFENLIGDRGSELVLTGKDDSNTSWLDIPDWKLEKSYEILCSNDFQTWVFHLAAYLNWAARNSRTTMSPALDALVLSLTRRRGIKDKFDQLTMFQKHAVRELLEYLAGNDSDTDATEAIASYWHETPSFI
ncbi:MAG: hypothetical protein NTY42_14220 [Planctomycetota bacterium]|nr:hypothetical protein [Planctomycetota bacterium]